VGLNSGQVIAGEIGSGPFGYTAIGEQVGMAQRMESSGVMLGVHRAVGWMARRPWAKASWFRLVR
jgi:class 3 adenylate cyclase